ncbi:hypothetical protein GCM10010399_68030 [Dactylosporangium fulvum]|uniref:Uncharacterized protein n=1 Tax=Dactylosporangium fulvum TaxID=53359 RepID=A0ABY5W133_9ACTN|nr:hypothetical protein [Dactylosporangium fulvum]UWP82816.1 hypothetical protein Dfulv_00385 [Dactylosporangium fulvum]
MYGWIWRHIPFKQWQLKALVSVVLAGAVGALLWYQVFPAVEPLLPFDDVQVETTDPGSNPLPPQPTGAPLGPAATSAVPTGSARQVLPS